MRSSEQIQVAAPWLASVVGAALLALAGDAAGQSRFRTIYDSISVGSAYSVLTVIETADLGFATSGNSNGQAFLLKVTADGTLAFHTRYNIFSAPGLDEITNGFVLAGEEISYDNPAVLVVDSGGIPQWARSYDQGSSEQGFYAVHPTADGGYLASGIHTVKLDGSGNVLWSKLHIGGGGNVNASAITADGGAVLTGEGQYGNPADGYNLVVTRLDRDGAVVWNRTYGGDDYDWSADVAPTGDGGYIVTGWTRSFTMGAQACFLLKLDTTGAMEWANTYAGATGAECQGVTETSDGGYAVTGAIDGELWLARTDRLGSVLWSRSFGGSTLGHSIRAASDGGFIAAGLSSSSLTLLKTDKDGDAATCNQTTPTLTVATAAFLSGTNSSAFASSWTASTLSPTATTATPTEKPLCNLCTPAPQAQVSATEICAGASIDLSATGSTIPGCLGAIEYRWRGSLGFLRDWSTVPEAVDTPAASTTYTLDIRCASPACQGSAAPLAVAVNLPPEADAGGALAACEGVAVQLGASPTASGGTPPYDFAWSAVPADPTLSCTGGPACANPSASPATDTAYTVVITDAKGCVSAPSSASLTRNPRPVVDAGADQAACAGNPIVLGGAPTASGGTPPYDHTWSAAPADPTLSCTGGPTCSNPGASPAATTVYTVRVTDALGCSTEAPTTVTVTVPAPPPDPGNSLRATRAVLVLPPDPGGIALSWSEVGGSAIAYHLRRSDRRDFGPPNGIVQSVAPGLGVVLSGEVASLPRLRLYRVTSSNCAGDESGF